jgi:molybdopterin synthase catalytic subunit
MAVRLFPGPFDPATELERHRQAMGRRGEYGACASFIGTMRDFNHDQPVEAMTLEHYPGMTERQLERICEEARGRWDILEALIVHRVGELRPAEPIVLVAAWSAHRAPAFEACRFLIEELKHRAPFWKQERHGEKHRWVEHNTPAA